MLRLAEIDRLHAAGLIAPESFLPAAVAVRDKDAWDLWARRALLALGAGQLLAGIVFFFAWNWAALPPFAKFGVIEGGMLVAIAAALIVGLDRPIGQALLIAASVLTGVLFAVIGQVYQTGADAWLLFAAWAALMLPFTVASRSAAHWLVWIVVLETALGLFAEQTLRDIPGITGIRIQAALGLLTFGFLALRELTAARGAAWLAARWTRLVLVAGGAMLLFWPSAGFLLFFAHDPSVLLLFAPAMAVLILVYTRMLPDFGAATMALGFASLAVVALGIRLIESTIGFTWSEPFRALFTLALMIGWSIGTTALTAAAAKRLRAAIGAAA